MGIEICQLFVFVDDCNAALNGLRSCGLTENFHRVDLGQGTAAAVACFDNLLLEVAWADDPAALLSIDVARTRLSERSRWRDTGASPFGIGLRGRLPFPSWSYRPPHLPDCAGMPVALGSEDPRQPFLFRAVDETRPDQWEDARAGQRQWGAALTEVVGVHLESSAGPAPSLRGLVELGLLTLAPAVKPRMVLTIAATDGTSRQLSLPDFTWVEG